MTIYLNPFMLIRSSLRRLHFRSTTTIISSWFILLFIALLSATQLVSQVALPRLSPQARVVQMIGITKITVEYSRPSAKGREIWGKLVPYNQVWRAGANEATTITFSETVIIEGKKIPAGSYAFFLIPTPTEWTVILNTEAKQWGAFTYKKEKDIHRFNVVPLKTIFEESLTYGFDDLKPSSARLFIDWEMVHLSFEIIAPAKSKDPKQEIRLSQYGEISETIGLTDITVTYHRPGVKSREIFGKLVPYNKVWRAGANEATTISFADPVSINGTKIPAGKYGFFILPTDTGWSLIFNTVPNQWGAFTYDEKKDFYRVSVIPIVSPFQEWLTYGFSLLTPSSAFFWIGWNDLRAGIPIRVDVQQKTLSNMRASIATAKFDDWKTLNTCARYCADNNFNIDESLRWIERSLAMQRNMTNLFTKALLLNRQNKKAEALTAAREALELNNSTASSNERPQIEKFIDELEQK